MIEDLEELGVSIRCWNVLKRLGAVSLADVLKLSRADLRAARGCGRLTIDQLVAELSSHGLRLAGDTDSDIEASVVRSNAEGELWRWGAKSWRHRS